MNQEQLKELESLDDRWVNNPLGEVTDHQIARCVMDLLPDVIQALKEREGLMANLDYSVNLAVATATEKLTAERDAALKALREEKEYTEALAKDICEMEDALGFRNDCTDKDGAFVPTKGPWKERVRDLIAKEGELGDANAKCAEMRHLAYEAKRVLAYVAYQRLPLGNTVMDTLPEHWQREVNTALDIIVDDCGRGYHADREWGLVVAALRQVDQCGMEHFKAFSCACAGGVKQALAHAEKLTEGK